MNDIVVIDYGMGNLSSVMNAFAFLGANCTKSSNPQIIQQAKAIILPGVGAFGAAIENIHSYGLFDVLTEEVMEHKKPFLGICLGLQLIAARSEEGKDHKGFGWIDGQVKKMEPMDQQPVPHVGWNNVINEKDQPLFKGISQDAHFYFDHSFHLESTSDMSTTYCEYGGKWISSIHKDNIFAVQFHPEKSQRNGLKLLRNFLNYVEHTGIS